LGVGYGVAYIGHNRLRPERDGSVTWFEKNWTGTSTSPVDPTVAVIRIDDMTGSSLAILANYACHPVIFGPDSSLFSADFPGVMTQMVEKTLGGRALCFFLQGAASDINPLYAVTPLSEGAVELYERTGTEPGRVVAAIAQQIRTGTDTAPSLQFAEDTLVFTSRWNAREWLAADRKSAATIAAKIKPEYALPVAIILINKQLAFLGLPGEPFVDFQRQWRARCPVRDCFLIGSRTSTTDTSPQSTQPRVEATVLLIRLPGSKWVRASACSTTQWCESTRCWE